jgi:hypothetical protein
MLIGMVVIEVTDYQLRTGGIRTVATVQEEQRNGRNMSYLLSFSDTKGNPLFEWSGDVSSGTGVGDQIHVAYDAADPSDVHDTRDLSRGPWAALIFLPGGLFFLWLSRNYFRAEPKAFRMWLKDRYRVR